MNILQFMGWLVIFSLAYVTALAAIDWAEHDYGWKAGRDQVLINAPLIAALLWIMV